MKRENLIRKAYDYSEFLSVKNKSYLEKVNLFLSQQLDDDLKHPELNNSFLDVTTNLFFDGSQVASAFIEAKEDGVIAGLDEINLLYSLDCFEIILNAADGDLVNTGDIVLELRGPVKKILEFERTGLNLLQRMSGIATFTKSLVDRIKDYETFIVATRKSQSKYLDKRAVTLGGGLSHRLGLYDGILIKDNHLDFLKKQGFDDVVGEALMRADKVKYTQGLKFIEIEVRNLEEASRAAVKFYEMKTYDTLPCIIMLDNMTPPEIKKVLRFLKSQNLYENLVFEASGMINENNIEQYAEAGVDVISMGCLTHSVVSFDLSQRIMEEKNEN